MLCLVALRFLSLFRPPCYDCPSLGSQPKTVEIGGQSPSSSRVLYLDSQQDHQVYLSVDEPFSGSILSDILGHLPGTSTGEPAEDWLMGIAQAALSVALEGAEVTQMSLLITDDETVHGLNAQFRGLDEVTDVLSFSADHAGHWEGDAEPPEDLIENGDLGFVMPPGELSPLGEVIVSYPQAQRQAEERGARLEHELALLVVHGVLHLTGHNHLESEETELMQSKECTALAALNIES